MAALKPLFVTEHDEQHLPEASYFIRKLRINAQVPRAGIVLGLNVSNNPRSAFRSPRGALL